MINGEQWIENHREIFSKLQCSYQIKRWDEWRNTGEYLNIKQRVEVELKRNEGFQQAMQASIDSFTKRQRANEGYNFMFDPGNMNPVLLKGYEIFVQPRA